MDLTFHTDQAKLNIRVAVILRSNNGYIFCESKEGINIFWEGVGDAT
jgi:hypothetical protein